MRRVLLVNWDGYPNISTGGVFTWEKALVEELTDWQFVIFNQLSNSNSNGSFKVPKNVTKVVALPLFGANRYEEFSHQPFVGRVLGTSERTIERHFEPLFLRFASRIISPDCQPSEVIECVLDLHAFLMRFDYKKCVESPAVWEGFLRLLRDDPLYREMSLNEALRAYQMMQRLTQTISIDLPKVDIVHCSLAWMPSLLAIVEKAKYSCPVIITEHGVALRELLLYYNGYTYDEASKVMMKVIATNIVKTLYGVADIIAPVCAANTEWELILGVPAEKIRVIYNGIDTKRFRPMSVVRKTDRPIVVSVGRIEIFKDLVSLITAIGEVKKEIPNIQCLIYGEGGDLDYCRKCVETVESLGLKDNVKFMGKTKEPEKAYNMGDVVAMSSVTEAFPFAAIEAMACGKPVVATDVGGTREAIEGCGILVRSRNSTELARGIVKLLKDRELRVRLGGAAIERVREKFELSASANQYRVLYEELVGRPAVAPVRKDPQLVVAR
ncbi:MAG: GT4 family glycosyltransferase PelF [Thaumarchaeota archaeon]|nr:GT4 family glycosyltransferase PelF [Nitrososphaerota archaeon]